MFTDRGYCPVVVERRGVGRSSGEQVVFLDPSFDLPAPPYLCRNSLHVGGDSWIEVTALPTQP